MVVMIDEHVEPAYAPGDGSIERVVSFFTVLKRYRLWKAFRYEREHLAKSILYNYSACPCKSCMSASLAPRQPMNRPN